MEAEVLEMAVVEGLKVIAVLIATAGDVCQVAVEQEEVKDHPVRISLKWRNHCRPPSRPAKYRLPMHWRPVCRRGSTPPRSPRRYGPPENAQTETPSSTSTSTLSRPEIC